MVLIVASNPALSVIWSRHLERLGHEVVLVHSQDAAVSYMADHPVDVIVLDLMLEDGAALAVADYANYRHPLAAVVFVTKSTFFSDGSIFNLMPNAAAFIEEQTPPGDLAAIVEYHGRA